MKITRLETLLVTLPLRQPGPPAYSGGRLRTHMETLLLRVETDAGLCGWGEAFAYAGGAATRATLETLIAPLALGRDATQIASLQLELQRRLHTLGRGGAVSFGLSALDIALWDLAGKAAGLPLHRLLGGAVRSEIPAYASVMRYGAAEGAARVAAHAVEHGYRHVKLHELTLGAARATRSAVGRDVALMLDVNCAWSGPEALEMARRLRECELLWLEEPLWPPEDHAGLAQLARAGGVALAAGENVSSVHEFRALLESRALAYLQPSPAKLGGVSALLQVAALARAFGTALMPHSPYFGPGLLAALHVLATVPEPALAERLYCELEPDLYGGLTRAHQGCLRLPQGPGLGADPDPAVLERYRTA